MANVTDQYASGYLYLPNVFTGALQPRNTAEAQQTGVRYRLVPTSNAITEWAASLGLAAQTSTFEVWSATLAAGYQPQTGDVWTDKDEQPWQVLRVDPDALVTSAGLPVKFFLVCQKAK